MAEGNHRYPSEHPPGMGWATDEAWAILDVLPVDQLNLVARSYLAGLIAGALEHYAADGAPKDNKGRGRKLPKLRDLL